jgi:hypothetical protein
MRDSFGSEAPNLYINLSPSIRSCCYQVGAEFKGYFSDSTLESKGNYYFDLAGENIRQALNCGVKLENISDANACTCCTKDDFFSYRRQGAKAGRMMSVIMLR